MRLKFSLIFLYLFLIVFSPKSYAQIETIKTKNADFEKIKVTGFDNYYPYGDFDNYNKKFNSVLKDFIEEFSNQSNYTTVYVPVEGKYDDLIRNSSRGAREGADIVLGIYSDTGIYNSLKFIYPAAIDNPIHLAMRANQVLNITSINDLKKLKGAIHKNEHFSDYVKESLSEYNIEYIDNSYDLYGKLIKGEVDYILTSIYFGLIETSKLGLRSHVAFSNKSIWTMPLFVGVSKTHSHRERLTHLLSKHLEKPETQKAIKDNLMSVIEQIQEQNKGVVPPTYALEEKAQ